MDVIVCTAGVGNVLRSSVSDRMGGGSVMVWAGICHDGRTQPKIVQGALNAVKYRDNILDPIVLPFLQQRNFEHVFQYDNVRCHGLVFVKTFWTRITSVLFLGRYYHRICHQFNIYGMNSVDMFVIVKLHQKHYRSCMMHLCTSGTTSPQAFIQQLVLCVGDAKLSLLEEVVIHVTELHKSPYCMTISVCQDLFW